MNSTVIDFHTHCFPDKLAAAAIGKLNETAKMVPATDGTALSLTKLMAENGVSLSVVANIATSPKQITKVNDFAIETKNKYKNLYPLGTANAFCEPELIKSELLRIKQSGIRGIKVHCDYMKVYFDDALMRPIFEACCEYGLFLMVHAGYDPISPDTVYASPFRISKVMNEYPELEIVAAHMGGALMWDEVEKHLVGKNVRFDTGHIAYLELEPSRFIRILNAHNPDYIMYGSDTPWCTYRDELNYIEALNISDAVREKIFYKNAVKLLDI